MVNCCQRKCLLVLSITLILGGQINSIACDGGGNGTEAPDETSSIKKLRLELLTTRQYDRMSRPVKNHLTQTKVHMQVRIMDVVHFDVESGVLVTDVWFKVGWRDEMLTWDLNDYQQLDQIHMSPNEIWRPDIVLINAADHSNMLNIFSDSEVIVNSTGYVRWSPTGMLYSKCPNAATNYPFIAKPVNCTLVFCTLIYESHEVNITTPGTEVASLIAGISPQFYVEQTRGRRFERTYKNYGTYSFEAVDILFRQMGNALPRVVRIPTLTAVTMILLMFSVPLNLPVRVHLVIFAMFIQIILILYISYQLGPNATGLAWPIAYLRGDLSLAAIALVATLVFRRLLVIADSLPRLPYTLSTFMSGPVGRIICFGANQKEYSLAPPSSSPAGSASALSSLKSQSRSISATSIQQSSSKHDDHVLLVTEIIDDDSTPLGSESGVAGTGGTSYPGLTHVIMLSNSQYEWMQLIVFCDRVMFIYYFIYMLPSLISASMAKETDRLLMI